MSLGGLIKKQKKNQLLEILGSKKTKYICSRGSKEALYTIT